MPTYSAAKGVARGDPGVPVTPLPFVSLFLSKQPTIFRGENAMTIMFDTVWTPPPPPPVLKNPGYVPGCSNRKQTGELAFKPPRGSFILEISCNHDLLDRGSRIFERFWKTEKRWVTKKQHIYFSIKTFKLYPTRESIVSSLEQTLARKLKHDA